MSNGACRVGPGIICLGQESASDGTGFVGPGIIRQGRRSCWTGLVASTPELSVGGPGWLRLWGVAGLPSVDTLAEGDAPSSLELTVGVDGDQGTSRAHRNSQKLAAFYSCWKSAFLNVENRKRGRFGGRDENGGESPGCRYRGLLCGRAER